MTTKPTRIYRAAFVAGVQLTDQRHATLSNAELLAEGRAEADRINLIGDQPHQVTADQIDVGMAEDGPGLGGFEEDDCPECNGLGGFEEGEEEGHALTGHAGYKCIACGGSGVRTGSTAPLWG